MKKSMLLGTHVWTILPARQTSALEEMTTCVIDQDAKSKPTALLVLTAMAQANGDAATENGVVNGLLVTEVHLA